VALSSTMRGPFLSMRRVGGVEDIVASDSILIVLYTFGEGQRCNKHLYKG